METGQQGYPVGIVFETQYYAQCKACGEEIAPGDKVFHGTQDELGHEVCPRYKKFRDEEQDVQSQLDGAANSHEEPPPPEDEDF